MPSGDILDDIDSEYFLPLDEILWSGKPKVEDAWLIGITVFIGFAFLMIFILFILSENEFNLDVVLSFAFNENSLCFLFWIIIVGCTLYLRKNEKYWLLKNRIAIRKGWKRNFKIFNFSRIDRIQHGIFEDDTENKKTYIVVIFKSKFSNPFSLFSKSSNEITLGPFENSKEVHSIFTHQFDSFIEESSISH